MKKTVPILILIILLFTSCVNPFVKFPEGSWESADKKIVLNFSEDPFSEYAGRLETGGKQNKIVIVMETNSPVIGIYGYSERNAERSYFDYEDDYYMSIEFIYVANYIAMTMTDSVVMTVTDSEVEEYSEGDEIVFTRVREE